MGISEALLMVITMNFGVLWSDDVYLRESSQFYMGISEELPMVMIMIGVLWFYGGDSGAR